MGFLAPGFLLGALAVGLPIYLHLLRRHGSPPQPFSSLMFFEPREQSSVRRRRLRYWWLLALRLAVVLLVALAFAEPYIPRLTAGLAPDKLLVLAIDRSLSMRAGTRLAEAKREALAVVARKRSGDSAQVLTLGSEVSAVTQATRDPSALRAAIESVEPSDSHGSYGALAAAMRSIAANARTPIELHLFSDLKRTSMPPSFAEMALPARVALVLHPLAARAEPNWTVESVAAPPEVWNPRATRVRAVIAGYATPAAQRTVSLIVNDRTVATRAVQVPAAGRAAVEFDSLDVAHGLTRCAVRIDSADTLAADDEYRFAVERSDPKHGLLIYQGSDRRSPLYFATALASAAPAAFQLEKLPVERAGSVDPQAYAFVVLSDVALLPDTFTDRLTEYVRRGGGVLIALGTAAAQQRAVPLFGGELQGARTYSREAQRFASIATADSTYPSVGLPLQWDGVRFFFATNVDANGSRVALRLSDGAPLLLERTLGEGRVVVFTSGFDNLTNDLPLHPIFVAFVDRTIRYLSGTEARSSSRTVDEFVALRTAREQGIGVEVVDPEGRRPLTLESAASAEWLQLAHAGYYELRLANGRRDLIAANPDRRESDLTPIPPDVLALWRGAAGANASVAAPATLPAAPAARSLWWYAMLLLLVAALAESAVGSRYLGDLGGKHP